MTCGTKLRTLPNSALKGTMILVSMCLLYIAKLVKVFRNLNNILNTLYRYPKMNKCQVLEFFMFLCFKIQLKPLNGQIYN